MELALREAVINFKLMEKRVSLDLGKTKVTRLFAEYFFPTLLSLLFSAVLNVTDGIFVGRGVGSDALAAINIAAPVFMIATGIGLMLGSGLSVVAAIHMSRANSEAANRTTTLAFATTLLSGILLCLIVLILPNQLCYIFGGSEVLQPYVYDYLTNLWAAMLCDTAMITGMFALRLDGSPRFAMMSNIIPALANIALDYLFVFPLGMGIGGAAVATSISTVIGVVIIAIYFMFFSKNLKVCRIATNRISHNLKEVIEMCKIGLPAFIGDTAISFMLVVGNYMFIGMLGEDGVAAFSVACYLMPMIFMFGNSIAQSAMPIVSYNHGCGQTERVDKTFKLSIWVGIATGILITAFIFFFGSTLAKGFLDPSTHAYHIAEKGLPLFSLGFLFFTLNIVLIGYFQSIEDSRRATIFMILRGYLFLLIFSQLIPRYMGEPGLWLTVPISEATTLILIMVTWKRGLTKPEN